MFPSIGSTEWMVLAALALIVVGPKDLPLMMRKFGKFVAKMRSMAADFRASFDDMARQSELDELRQEIEAMRSQAAAEASKVTDGLDFNPMVEDFSGYGEPEPEPAPKPKPRKPKAVAATKRPASKTAAPAKARKPPASRATKAAKP